MLNWLKLIVIGLLTHIVILSALGAIGWFVWNIGIAQLLSNPSLKISYLTSIAVMTGVYVIDLWLKSYINKLVEHQYYKNQSKVIDKLFNKKK